uniref:Methyltransferase domain-containing protein n=1 Tax=Schlesneria paludicola TaxID=360056 RepID=A0A7C2P238_9PLAN
MGAMNLLVHLARLLNVVPVPLLDTQSQMLRARAVIEANRLGVFETLAAAPQGLTADEVAHELNISPAGSLVLLTALAGVGYLRQRRGRFVNGRWVKHWLLNPRYSLKNFLLVQSHSWQRLNDLGAVIESGRPVRDYYHDPAITPAESETFSEAMRDLSRLLLPEFLKRARLPAGARRLLDIGGGHGDYGRALARRHPGLAPTVLDLEHQIRAAQRAVEAKGDPLDVEFRVGDALTADLGTDWDVLLMVNLVHIFSPDQNGALFRRAREALRPGGVLLIVDQLLGVSRTRDGVAALISLNMFSIGGRCYRWQELERLLREAGFRHVRLKPFSVTVASSLVEAWT